MASAAGLRVLLGKNPRKKIEYASAFLLFFYQIVIAEGKHNYDFGKRIATSVCGSLPVAEQFYSGAESSLQG